MMMSWIRPCMLAAAALLLFVLSQQDAVPADTVSAADTESAVRRHWGEPVGGQAISIATTKAAYAPEEPIVLDVHFKNLGQQQVPVVGTHPLALYQISVRFSNGKDVPWTLCGKKQLRIRACGYWSSGILKPGEETSIAVKLSRWFDLSLADEYSVCVHRNVRRGISDKTASKATSNTLVITIDETLDWPRESQIEEP